MKRTIMVVDDSKVVYAEMKKILADAGIEIVAYCRNGEDALKAYEISNPEIVTMDIVMPGMDGLDAAESIIKKWPKAKVIMVSSLAYDDTIQRAKEIGTKGFIFKPFVKEEMLKEILRVFDEE